MWGVEAWDAVEKNKVYFQTSRECSGVFWFVRSCVLTMRMYGLVAPKTFSQIAALETWISAGITISISARVPISGIATKLQPSCARDLVNTERVGSTRFASPECVTTGVGSVSRGARAVHNLFGRSLRLHYLMYGFHSFCRKCVTYWQSEMSENSGNDLRDNKCNVYHNAVLKTALPTGWWSNWRKPKPFQYLLDQCSTSTMTATRARSKCARRSAQKNFHAATSCATQTFWSLNEWMKEYLERLKTA